MKIIDLLNKIANGEEVPKKIKYNGIEYKKTRVILDDNRHWNNYIDKDIKCLFPVNMNKLNIEVEIIEEEKGIPERLNVSKDEEGRIDDVFMSRTELAMRVKINEIIDYLKSKGE